MYSYISRLSLQKVNVSEKKKSGTQRLFEPHTVE